MLPLSNPHHVLSIPELLISIFEFLPQRDLLAAALVCWNWSKLAQDMNWTAHPVKLSRVVAMLERSEESPAAVSYGLSPRDHWTVLMSLTLAQQNFLYLPIPNHFSCDRQSNGSPHHRRSVARNAHLPSPQNPDFSPRRTWFKDPLEALLRDACT